MTFSPTRRPRRTHARSQARAADLARRLHESKKRYATLDYESRRKAEALARLDQVRSAIGRENSVDMILRAAVEAIVGIFGYPSVSIYMLEKNALSLRHGIGHTQLAIQVLSHSLPLGHVALTGEPLMIADTSVWPKHLDIGPGVASVISAPLRVGGQVTGVLHIESSRPDALGIDDLSWITTLSDHIGKAVERTRLRGDLQRTVRETMALNRIMSVIASASDTREALQTICADLADAFGVPQALCALLSADGAAQTVVAEYRDVEGPSVIGAVIPVRGNLLTQDLIARRQPVVLSNLPMNPRPGDSRRRASQNERVSLLVVPVLINDEVVGTIGLSSADAHIFTPDDVALAQRLSTTIGQALANLRLTEGLRQELTEFLSTMRHEIRDPIYSVIAKAEQLLATPLHAGQRADAEAIRASGEAMLGIISAILDLARVERGDANRP